MRTYIYTETSSPVRGMDTRITVYRIKNNQPHEIGNSDHQTAAWMGARAQACGIINDIDGISWSFKRDGHVDRYSLQGLLGYHDMYENNGHPRGAVRLFGIC